MSHDSSLRHVEEEAQKRDIVAMAAILATGTPNISEVVRRLEAALQAAYERGYWAGHKQLLDTASKHRPKERCDASAKPVRDPDNAAMTFESPEPFAADQPPPDGESDDD